MKQGYQIDNQSGFDIKVKENGGRVSDVIPSGTDPFISSNHEAWLEILKVDNNGDVVESMGDLKVTHREGHVTVHGEWRWDIRTGVR